MNARLLPAVTPLTFRRRRADALHLGPSDDAINSILEDLKANDAEVIDASGCFEPREYDELDALMVAAYRSGDWATYGVRYSELVTETLMESARLQARREQVSSWDDTEEP